MVKKLMVKKFGGSIVMAALLLLLGACQQKTAKQSPIVTPIGATPAASNPAFSQPTVAQVKPEQMPTLAIPGLMPATSPNNRVAQLNGLKKTNSQRDPFSLLPPGISLVPPLPSSRSMFVPPVSQPKKIAKLRPNPVKARSVRPQSTQRLTKRPVVRPVSPIFAPAPVAIAPMPVVAMPVVAMPVMPIEVAAAPLPPALPPTNLADSVEISGVMQIGGKTMVIAKTPNDSSARYVQAGDVVAGGQVHVKSVQIGPRGEPIVVLEQNGVEVTKSVGDTGPRAAAMR
jgi:hypothetical protein